MRAFKGKTPGYLLLLSLGLVPLVLANPVTVRVTRVIDGDTMVTSDGTKVRYVGVNTPEKGQPFAAAAARLNRELVLGKEVRLIFDQQKKDGYGRTLAYVYVGKEMVNARLLAEGMAHVFVLGSLGHYQDFLRIQREARVRAKGIWGKNGFPGPLKITSLHADAKGNDRTNLNNEYVRICNLSNGKVALKGFSLADDYAQRTGRSVDGQGIPHRYVFPEVFLEPGYTLLLLTGTGPDITGGSKNLVLHWRSARPIWNNNRDTAYLLDPDGNVIDTFFYVGKQHSRE